METQNKKKMVSIKTKIIGLGAGAIILSIILIAGFSLFIADDALEKEAFNKLTSVRDSRKVQIENFFREKRNDIFMFTENPFVKSAFHEISGSYEAAGGIEGGRFKGYSEGKFKAPDSYKSVHSRYISFFKQYMEKYGYYDILLMHADDGDTFFTVDKKDDFAARVRDIQSSLHDVWKIASADGKAAISDTKPYKPSDNLPAQFIAAPIKENGRIIGVAAFQISFEEINKIMTERTGMGETGDAYLVGRDNLMRSDSYHDRNNRSVVASFRDPEKGKIITSSTKKALEGKSGTEVINDYFGNEVLSSYTPMVIGSFTWALVAEEDMAEVDKPVDVLRNYISLGALLVIALAGLAFYLFINRSIVQPILRIKESADLIKEGDFSRRIDVTQNDELGMLAEALNKANENLENVISDIVGLAENVARGDLSERINIDAKGSFGSLSRLANALDQSTSDLEKIVSDSIAATQNLSQAVEQISSGNQNLSQRTSEQASSLEEIASTIEEAAATIKNNAENAIEAKNFSDEAFKLAEAGGKILINAVSSINKISESGKRIENIISVINEIAFQTNLLSLNAAVEAARAGEQGRGFAVVAGEVRNLAQRAGNSAKEISDLIKSSLEKIETGTNLVNESGESLNEIIGSAKKAANIISEIAAASEEQRQGIEQINTAISDMDTMTQQNAALVEETASASEEMANQAQELMGMMENFKISDSIKTQIYSHKHRELHIKQAAPDNSREDRLITADPHNEGNGNGNGNGNGKDKNNGNGRHKINSPAIKKNITEGDYKQALLEEGFEEF